MKPYAFNVKLPGESTSKTVVARPSTMVNAWHKIEKAYPDAELINVTCAGNGQAAGRERRK